MIVVVTLYARFAHSLSEDYRVLCENVDMTRVTKLLIVIALAVIASAAQTLSPGGLDMVDGSATAATYKGKTAVRITNAKANDAIGIVKGSKFSNGTLELNVAGAPGPGARPPLEGSSVLRSASRGTGTSTNISISGRRMGELTIRCGVITRPNMRRIPTTRGSGSAKRNRRSTSRMWIWNLLFGPQ